MHTRRFADGHATRLEQLFQSTLPKLALASLGHRFHRHQRLLSNHHVDLALDQIQFADTQLFLATLKFLLVSLLLIQQLVQLVLSQVQFLPEHMRMSVSDPNVTGDVFRHLLKTSLLACTECISDALKMHHVEMTCATARTTQPHMTLKSFAVKNIFYNRWHHFKALFPARHGSSKNSGFTSWFQVSE